MNNKLQTLRAEIDQIDAQIISLLIDRQAVVGNIAAQKAAQQLPTADPNRESTVIAQLQQLAGGQLPPALIETLYTTIFAHSKAVQTQLRKQQ